MADPDIYLGPAGPVVVVLGSEEGNGRSRRVGQFSDGGGGSAK